MLHEQAAEQCIREDERREDQAYRGSAVTGFVREDGVWCDAWISDDGVYRYTLTRGFNGRPPTAPLVFCMLNPSTADHREDDATIVRCCGFARRERRDGILVVNLFALRSTVPVKLALVADPVGPHNDSAITAAACSAAPLVVAWGANARRWPTRVQRVVGLVGRNLLCLGTTKAGHPKHPLYLMALTPLMDWSPA